jgi:hypothetical protein
VSNVSFYPSVLDRYLRRLLDAFNDIGSNKEHDLFPQTHHVETLVRLMGDGQNRER